MRKNILLIMVFVLSISLISCKSQEASIKEEIFNANFCETKEDCVLVGSKCPFDCYIYSNSNEAERIRGLVENYNSNCEYSCIRCPDVECVEGKCRPVCE